MSNQKGSFNHFTTSPESKAKEQSSATNYAQQAQAQQEQAQTQQNQQQAEPTVKTAPEAEIIVEEQEQAQDNQEASAQAETEDTVDVEVEPTAEQDGQASAEDATEQAPKVQVPQTVLNLQTSFKNIVSEQLPEVLNKIANNQYSEVELRKLKKEFALLVKKFNSDVCVRLENGNDKVLQLLTIYKAKLEELPRQLERAQRDAAVASNYANEKIVKGPIKNLIETFRLSLNSFPKNSQDPKFLEFAAEIKAFDAKLRKDLEDFDIVIFGKEGDTFDPNEYDAISQFPAQLEEQKGKVAYVSAEGFKLKDRVIEPAKVVVYLED